MWLKWIYGNIGTIGDRAGQLGENGEYWMGKKGSGLIWYSELQGGSHCLCRLRPASVGSEWTSFELCTGTYRIFWGPANLLASMVAELDDTLPYLTGDTRYSAWATHGVSTKAYVWKTCTRVRWARLDSLTVIVNCCHSWYLRDPRVLCCQVISLARLTINSNLCNTLRNEWCLFATPKHSNSTFVMLLGWWDGYRLLGSRWED
jgi:hypothetical protein